MMKFILYNHKNQALSEYLVAYSNTLSTYNAAGKVELRALPALSTSKEYSVLPTALRKLLFFARPDCVVCLDDGIRETRPVFAIELTEHVPAQDHWMQRFNNLVGCALEGVPGAYILPFHMPKHPTFKSSLDEVFFYAYDRVTEIHQTPTYIAEWETVDGATVKNDPTAKFAALPDHNSPDLRATFQFLEKVLESAIHGRPVYELMRDRLIVDLRNKIRKRAYKELPEVKNFKRLAFNLPSNRYLTHTEFETWLGNRGLTSPADLSERIKRRNNYLIWVPQVERTGKTVGALRVALNKRILEKGGDPYLGQPLAFDYIFCRLGETPHQRDVNLVIDLGVLKFADFAEYHKKVWSDSPLQFTKIKDIKHIPTYTMHLKEGFTQAFKNVVKIYAYSADVIVFEDGLVYF